ncbi:Arylsulfatase A [Actinopolymorpha cephalotaxi]|uniref:Arylsulfatase A n=1 Tax=Actinopolymorpha cephalotaxi TaxID=504797 RepID=A0A1I2LE82_9ACTN|nr:sulfatase [Actinopolymorpha cephalotaxi]NYH85011.1 arylsulfatase A-like enzyme [Actinopolymorpha cephalotaxi]SFF75777.1 Arylsulfatase A [Actinopolymorpha cephalotaxi]
MPQSGPARHESTLHDSSRPNVVVMHCHDLGRFLGCYGNETVATPHLDALAADGVRFDRSFTTAPQCSPSRASLFTGRYPHVNGVLGLTHQDFAWDLHPGERHLGGLLRDQGYRTALIGVQHESRARTDEELAARLGFDHVDAGMTRAEPVSKAAVDHLGQLVEGDRPFYLQVGFLEPHRMPGDRDEPGVMGFLGNHLEPDDSLGVAIPAYLQDTPSARTELAELQGAVRHMDEAAGRVLAELDRLGATGNTIMVFTTDHGLALPRAKCSLYDPGLETALIIRYPDGGWTGGQVHDALVSHVDLLPTLLAAVGSAAGDEVHGRSFLPLLNGEEHPRRQEIFGEMTYHDYYDPRRCIRTERHKLIANFSSAPAFMDPSQGWMRRCRPKVQTEGPASYHPSLELYDLAADPAELTNLVGDPDHAGVVAELSAKLAEWMTRTKDPLVDGAVTSPLHSKTMNALLRA